MWNKAYLALLAVASLLTAFFAYYAWTWLGSIGDPRVAWANYAYHRQAGILSMVVATLVLLAVGNVILWLTRAAWGLWASLVYFGVASIVLFALLGSSADGFCIENRLCEDPSKVAGILAAVFGTIGVGILVFIDQYVVLRLREKMYGIDATPPEEEKENSRPDEAES